MIIIRQWRNKGPRRHSYAGGAIRVGRFPPHLRYFLNEKSSDLAVNVPYPSQLNVRSTQKKWGYKKLQVWRQIAVGGAKKGDIFI